MEKIPTSKPKHFMNKKQKKVVDEYCEKYGGVEILEIKKQVVLKLAYNMIIMEGLSYNWLSRFAEHFYEIGIGMSDDKEYPMYISMFKFDINK